MNPIKPIGYLALWTLLGAVIYYFLPGLPQIFEPRTGLFVLALPWLISFAGMGPGAVLSALRDPLLRDVADLPHARRMRSAGILRKLGSISVSAGILAFFASAIATLNSIASSGGQANPMEFVAGAPAALLAPLFGYFLCSFVYEPLAVSIESEDSGLGMELEG